MKITIHRGTHHIGGCVTEISSGNDKVFIDFGADLPGTVSAEFPKPIAGLTVPDGSNSALFFTHYHGDHVGRLREVQAEIPIYMGKTAKALFENYARRTESGILERIDSIISFSPLETIRVGNIAITPLMVDHSAFDAYMFVIEADGKRVLHTGYEDFFLILWDAVRWAKAKNIPVGPGRGAMSGSLCAYGLGITELDPIKYNLLFERFLNRETDIPPNFALDVGRDAQPKMINYLIQKYGAERVARSIEFDSMSAKTAILWSALYVIDIPYDEAEKIADMVPSGWNMTIERALNESAELCAWIEQEPRRKELIETAKKLEGMTKSPSLSASGAILSPTPISDHAPLCIAGGQVAAQYSDPDLEEIGLQEMNIFGMRCLSEIAEAERMIRRTKPKFRIKSILLDIPEVYQMLSDGETDGIFQIGYQRNDPDINQILKELQPDCFEHLIALTAMYRPGTIDSIPTYIENRHYPERIKYLAPQLKSILDVTYGGMIYQEQLMRIFEKMAGYSLDRANITRRALAKKNYNDIKRERNVFIYGLKDKDGTVIVDGCLRRGIDKDSAGAVFDRMLSVALYAFCRAHAVAYALLTYRTAYLKCFYPEAWAKALAKTY